ncbi:MAG TPA: radical SAM protein [Phycisphaerae bacterium]|nr:radical SAM protein [Phycisphaerae bacterium]
MTDKAVVNATSGAVGGAARRDLAPVPEVRFGSVNEHRRSVRRFADRYARLPAATQATCPTCGQVVAAVFDRCDGQIVLTYACGPCGPRREVHHDRIWTCAAGDFPGSAARTFHGARIRPVVRRLPRTVETLCPECAAIVLGRYFVKDGAVLIEKTCPEHGYFRDCVNSDVLLHAKAAWWTFEEHPGQQFPQVTGTGNCPSDCGLCDQHLSSPCLAQIDLTNRCNLRCPICFANAGASGYVCEPDYDEIVRQLQVLRDLRPTPCTAIQFTGGEPTLHPDFLRILSAAREMGFSHIQIATNGVMLADPAFARQAAEAGLHTLYLQFDGVGEKPHRQTRGAAGIWKQKLAVLENCRTTGMKICLVPTLVKGINDDQVGEIFHFAVKNIDVVSAISYQPVSFTGRIEREELSRRRYTLGDMAHAIAAASGAGALRHMYPLSIVVPLSQILEALTGRPKVRPSCHPDCAFGTYFLVSPEGKAYPFPQVIDVEGMFWEMNRIAARIRARGKASRLDKWRVLRMFQRHFRTDAAPPGLTVRRFVRSLQGLVDKGLGRGEGEKRTYKTLLCAGMHFMDRYNYDVERVKRCVILYSTPAGVFPFCTYNCGPEYRRTVEREFAEAVEDPGQTAGRSDSGASGE